MQTHERLTWVREHLSPYRTASEAARAMGIPVPTYAGHENGSRGLKPDVVERYAAFYRVSPEWILYERGKPRPDSDFTVPDGDRPIPGLSEAPASPFGPMPPAVPQNPMPPNAGAPEPARLPRQRIPVYGHAAGGDDGRFLLNGQRVADVLCPPSLEHVPGAYAVYIHGESMVPRYFPGETAWVHPTLPVKRDDFVVAQIQGEDGEPPLGFVKQFVARTPRELVLRQLNPPEGQGEEMRFPIERVISVHRILFAGQS